MIEQLAKGITLHCGDCLEILPSLAENSIDSCCTDPPYHLTSIVQRFANAKAEREAYAATSKSAYMSRGFMGKQWDGGDIAFQPELWKQVYRALKPGAHLLAFGGTRTFHRMACAIEDAGFEVRDQIQWLYGSGFPKSHDVSKGINRAAGAEREIVGHGASGKTSLMGGLAGIEGEYGHDISSPATEAARQWQGWGTALKPACEPIVMARKPLSEATVAANVLKWGTGAINVDGCRVLTDDNLNGGTYSKGAAELSRDSQVPGNGIGREFVQPQGRWPANVIHDGSEEVVEGFPIVSASPPIGSIARLKRPASEHTVSLPPMDLPNGYGDSGSAARFFYTAKADSDDRLGSKHPTVKPLDLIQYLVRLVTPKGGTVLDPFAGTGTAGEAAWREGLRAVLIERELEYQDDIRRRMKLCMAGPDERSREAIKAKLKDKPIDAGPLFGGGM